MINNSPYRVFMRMISKMNLNFMPLSKQGCGWLLIITASSLANICFITECRMIRPVHLPLICYCNCQSQSPRIWCSQVTTCFYCLYEFHIQPLPLFQNIVSHESSLSFTYLQWDMVIRQHFTESDIFEALSGVTARRGFILQVPEVEGSQSTREYVSDLGL